MSRIIRICPGVGDRKGGAFLSSVDRDPHPTCTRCRGKVCTMDITCDICADWSVAQWEQFVKKRAYKDRKKTSRPSGSVPPAPLASPRAETSSGVSRPGTSSSSSSRPLGGQGKQEGSQGAPGVVSRGVPSPPARSRSSERGGSASGQSSGAPPLLLRERAKWELPARSRLPLPAPLPRLSLPNPHRTFDDVRIRGRLRSLALACCPPVVPDLRIEEHGRIREPGQERVAPVDVAIVLALSPLPVRGQEVESVDADHCPGRSLLMTGRGLLTATSHGVEALGRDVTGRGLLTATGRAVSERVPLPAGEIGVTARGHTLSRIALVTARGHAGDYLAPLPARGLWNQDGWPDEKHRRVLRRLPLSLLRFLKWRWRHSCCRRGCFTRASVCCTGSCQVLFEPVRILFPGGNWRRCESDCISSWVGGCCVPAD